jgi:antitoxin ParD1/3/4
MNKARRLAGGSGIALELFVLVRQIESQQVIAVEKRMFTIPAEQASYIDELVAAGTYASASAVVSAGLAALQERETATEQWLREEVIPVYDAMEVDPARGLSADEVTAAIRSRHAKRLNTRKRGT